MKVQLYIDPSNQLSKVPYQVPNNIHYVRYQDYLDAQTQPDALTAYLYAAELAKDNIKKLKAEVEKLTFEPLSYLDDAGEWMPRHTHLAAVERLKAECQARQAENSVLAVECDSLKAEVERLKADNEQLQNRCDFLEGNESKA